jgi:hypothetical protein
MRIRKFSALLENLVYSKALVAVSESSCIRQGRLASSLCREGSPAHLSDHLVGDFARELADSRDKVHLDERH